MKAWEETGRGLVFVSLHNGDDVLDCVRQAVEQHDLADAIVLTGVGALKHGRYHVIASNNYPPGNTFIELDGPLEISNLAGVIAGGVPHLHLTLFDKDQRAWGGHLEQGCTVLTLCELTIQRLDTRMIRRPRDPSGVKVLDVD